MSANKKKPSTPPSPHPSIHQPPKPRRTSSPKNAKTTPNQPNLTTDEKPCCSKSLKGISSPRPHLPHNRHVRFSDDVQNDSQAEQMEQKPLFPESPNISPENSNPPSLTEIISVYSSTSYKTDDNREEFIPVDKSFSDSVLTLPNLFEYESILQEERDDTYLSGESNNLVDKFNNHHLSVKFNESEETFKDEASVSSPSPNRISSGHISSKPPKLNFVQYLSTWNSNDDNGNEHDDYYEEGYSTERHDEEGEYDENNNVILWPHDSEKKLIKHASYIFHEDRRDDLIRLTSLMPRGREYAMFNIFTDLARFVGLKGRRKRVNFPKEIVDKYEQQGDVAGKDRFVPTAKTPYKGIQMSSKKRKLSAVYSSWTVKSAEFVPKMDRVDHAGRCEHCFEKYVIMCDCCRCGKKVPDLSNVMEGYLGDLNLASLFLHGHATRTFESAMSNLEFIKYHDSRTATYSQIPWATNYAKQRLGILSCSIWVFTFCIRTIIKDARDTDTKRNTALIPSENSFRKIMEQYASLCITLSENIKTVLQYGHNFYNFCKECVRIIRVLQIHIGFKSDLHLKKPLRRGKGLDLNRMLMKWEIIEQRGIEVKVSRSKPIPPPAAASYTETGNEGPDSPGTPEQEEEVPDWKYFEELSGPEKASCLKHLLNVTSEGMNMVQTQLRFLMDDIVDSVKDVNEADLLFLMADMFDRIKFLENLGTRKVKAEIGQISKLMTDFSKDFQSFMDYGRHIVKRFIELRDMVHLCHEFMVKGLKIEMLEEMVPVSTFKRKRNLGCCGVGEGRRGMKRVVSNYQPKYKVLDFFKVYYMDAVKTDKEIYANKFSFMIQPSEKLIKAVIPFGEDHQTWGDATSPRHSLDEYVDDEDVDDDDSFTGPNAAGERLAMEHIKPIIASHLGSPQGSIDLTIDSVPNAEDSGARTSAEAEKGNSAAAPPSKKERGSGSDGGSHNDDKK